jgi:hypothetical protein
VGRRCQTGQISPCSRTKLPDELNNRFGSLVGRPGVRTEVVGRVSSGIDMDSLRPVVAISRARSAGDELRGRQGRDRRGRARAWEEQPMRSPRANPRGRRPRPATGHRCTRRSSSARSDVSVGSTRRARRGAGHGSRVPLGRRRSRAAEPRPSRDRRSTPARQYRCAPSELDPRQALEALKATLEDLFVGRGASKRRR